MAYLHCSDPVRGDERDVPIRKALSTIGRSDGNDVVLADASLAPTHANLLRKGNHFTLSVVDRNTIFMVNGQRARSTDLRVGDEVMFGRYVLTLMEGEPRGAVPVAETGPALPTLQRVSEFVRDLMADTSLDRMFSRLMEEVVKVTRAEKGFLIAFREDERLLAAAHNVGTGATDLSRISDSIVDRVIQDRKPLIVSDALRDATFSTARSVLDLRLSSVMCVPLIYRNELRGVLYLGNDNVRNLFGEQDLAMLEVYSSLAAMAIHIGIERDELQHSNRNLREQLRQSGQGGIIYACAPMKDLLRVIRRVAPADIGVLVLGETGTGKELIARELHRLSSRKDKPFVAVNCGAIPENLLESELFGHRRGAFTGAVADKIGRFESADGGTIFLDEIGEMPMALQVKLLRVLQERVIERVGDVRGRSLDIRVIAATNKNLAEEISQGNFREDLFYRLNEVTLTLPPLRERGDDVVQIAQFFLVKYAGQYGSKARGLTQGCINAMRSYYWPGNIRELENKVKKAVIMTDRAQLLPEDLGITQTVKKAVMTLAQAEEEFKKQYIRQALDGNHWNKAQTARDLDVDPRTIFRYIERFDD